jgi:nucleotide-binding universal stress UspA family protein
MRILVALDAGEASRKVIDYLVRHREMFGGARLVALYIDAPPPLRAVGAFGADPGMPALTPGDPEALMAPALQALRAAGYGLEFEVREGEPGPEITQAAVDGGFDLIVLGAGVRGLLRRKLLGSVAQKVLTLSRTPMLIVR